MLGVFMGPAKSVWTSCKGFVAFLSGSRFLVCMNLPCVHKSLIWAGLTVLPLITIPFTTFVHIHNCRDPKCHAVFAHCDKLCICQHFAQQSAGNTSYNFHECQTCYRPSWSCECPLSWRWLLLLHLPPSPLRRCCVGIMACTVHHVAVLCVVVVVSLLFFCNFPGNIFFSLFLTQWLFVCITFTMTASHFLGTLSCLVSFCSTSVTFKF